jgi:hypothetical protein
MGECVQIVNLTERSNSSSRSIALLRSRRLPAGGGSSKVQGSKFKVRDRQDGLMAVFVERDRGLKIHTRFCEPDLIAKSFWIFRSSRVFGIQP